jgi:tRNA G18 (ribose-2'-O)-methylase SpoU
VSELLARVNDDSRARSLVVALDEVTNPENVGGVLRNAFAFGARCALLSVGCAHPLYRKALRTSMGAALQVPFTITRHWPAALAELGRAGYARVALSPAPDARDLAEVAAELHACPRVALVVGREGDGLSAATLAGCELRARIPMAPGVDSLNVATASGIAMHRLAGL